MCPASLQLEVLDPGPWLPRLSQHVSSLIIWLSRRPMSKSSSWLTFHLHLPAQWKFPRVRWWRQRAGVPVLLCLPGWPRPVCMQDLSKQPAEVHEAQATPFQKALHQPMQWCTLMGKPSVLLMKLCHWLNCQRQWDSLNFLCLLWLLLSSVQLLSHVRLFVTPWTAACQASLSITNSWSPPKLMSIESVMPSNHLILCPPLLLLPSVFPRIRVLSNESGLHVTWAKY